MFDQTASVTAEATLSRVAFTEVWIGEGACTTCTATVALGEVATTVTTSLTEVGGSVSEPVFADVRAKPVTLQPSLTQAGPTLMPGERSGSLIRGKVSVPWCHERVPHLCSVEADDAWGALSLCDRDRERGFRRSVRSLRVCERKPSWSLAVEVVAQVAVLTSGGGTPDVIASTGVAEQVGTIGATSRLAAVLIVRQRAARTRLRCWPSRPMDWATRPVG